MRHSVDLPVDELADTLRRTADFLGTNRIELERLTVTPGDPARLTVVFPAHTNLAAVQGFARAVRGTPRLRQPEPSATPFHWQADGAGDERVG